MIKHAFGVEIYHKGCFCGQIIHEAEIDDNDEYMIMEIMRIREYLEPYSLSSDLYEVLRDDIILNEKGRFQRKLFPYCEGTEFPEYSFKICV